MDAGSSRSASSAPSTTWRFALASRRSRPDTVALLLAAALLVGACSVTPGAQTPPPDDDLIENIEVEREPVTTGDDTPAETGTLEVITADRTGRRRADIKVRVTGPAGERWVLTTDAEGRARQRVAPGSYRVQVLTGCRGRMEVSFGSGGRVGITGGVIVRAPLRVEAIRRYAAGPPAYWDTPAPWPRGKDVRFRFRVYDRCTDVLKPNFRFNDLDYRPSRHLLVVDGRPRRTDDEAFVEIVVRCVRSGDASLILGELANPADGQDLLAMTPPADPSAAWCD